MTKEFVRPRYSALHFRQLRGYKTKICPVCQRKFGPKVTAAGTLELRGSFEKRRACSDLCKSVLIREAHKERLKDKVPEEATAAALVATTVAPPKAQSEVAQKLGAVIDAKRNARKIAAAPKTKVKSPAPKTTLPAPRPTPSPPTAMPEDKAALLQERRNKYSLYDHADPKVDANSEILRERAERIAAGTFDPTPDGEKIELDAPLKRALRKALLHHDPDFIECWAEAEKASAASGRDPAPYPGVAAA